MTDPVPTTAIAIAVVSVVMLIATFVTMRSALNASRGALGAAQTMLEQTRRSLSEIRLRFADVLNLDAEKATIERQIAARTIEVGKMDELYLTRSSDAERQHDQLRAEHNQELDNLRENYRLKKAVYDRLVVEAAIFDERLTFAEMGVYEPHFEFEDSEEYKTAITQVRERQKTMVTAKTAVFCTTRWAVDGSASKGQTMTNRGIRLTLRAFNNECDAAVSNTRWNNVNAMEKRIIRARDQIDNLNASSAIFVSDDYLELKLAELFLTHEYREKLKIEREERAEAGRLAKEEQRLIRDTELAQKDEEHYARLLSKAKAEAQRIVGPKLDAFEDQIRTLETDLADARARVERAQAMAERTRSGYVYIISNIGSFGEGVVKIGLTRRLDPIDRVRELGDASVPFVFDTHAIIYSDDAPALERALHTEFATTRINTQNYRKEFFRASIREVEDAVARLAPGAPFFKDVEAQEYRETLYRRQQVLSATEPEREIFPVDL